MAVALYGTQTKAVRAILSRQYRTVCWTGIAGSGKGLSTARGMMALAVLNHSEGIGNGQYGLAGQSVPTFERSNGLYLRQAAEWLGIKLVRRGGVSDRPRYEIPGVAEFLLYGGGKRGTADVIRGLDASAIWMDEASVLDEEFIDMAYSRLRTENSQMIMTQNATVPTHFVKREIIDNPPPRTRLLFSKWPEDWQHIPMDIQESLRSGNPNSAHYRRLFANEWCVDSGLVYDIPYTVDYDYVPKGNVVIDPGTRACAALLVVPLGGGRWLVADEYYHTEAMGRRTQPEHWAAIRGRWPSLDRVYVDSAAAEFRELVHRDGYWVGKVRKGFEENARVINDLMHGGIVEIHQNCKILIGSAQSVLWNRDGTASKPRDEVGGDHETDCLAYICTFARRPREFLSWAG